MLFFIYYYLVLELEETILMYVTYTHDNWGNVYCHIFGVLCFQTVNLKREKF